MYDLYFCGSVRARLTSMRISCSRLESFSPASAATRFGAKNKNEARRAGMIIKGGVFFSNRINVSPISILWILLSTFIKKQLLTLFRAVLNLKKRRIGNEKS
jgi:hypothetical protein